MEDEKIVALYWDRNEQAIAESSVKYGAYCCAIAGNILNSSRDAEECVNDTWLRAWNAMPPQKPSVLSVFFGKITRNLSFDLWRRKHRQKRGEGGFDTVLDELAECVSGKDDTVRQWEEQELIREIDRFLSSLPREKRYMFILRYWYADSISGIARRFGATESNVTVILFRIRKELKKYLIERGFDV